MNKSMYQRISESVNECGGGKGKCFQKSVECSSTAYTYGEKEGIVCIFREPAQLQADEYDYDSDIFSARGAFR